MLNLSNVLQLVIHCLYYSPLPEKQFVGYGHVTFRFNKTVDYHLPLSRLGIIQTSLASALAAPSVVGNHFWKQMAHVLAYLFEIEMLQAAIP